jgi:hypothetical protein
MFIAVRKYRVRRGSTAEWAQRVLDGFVPLGITCSMVGQMRATLSTLELIAKDLGTAVVAV